MLCSPKISLLQYSCSITVSVACLHRLKSKESQLTVELRLVRKSSSRSSSPANRNGRNIECRYVVDLILMISIILFV